MDRPEPSAVVGEDPDEDALITGGALEDQGYFRADAPLDYELQDVLQTAAQANGVPYHVALGLIYVESRFDPEAVSRLDAVACANSIRGISQQTSHQPKTSRRAWSTSGA